MWIKTNLAEEAKPGQFLCIYPKDKSTLLPRPISICEVGEDRKSLRFLSSSPHIQGRLPHRRPYALPERYKPGTFGSGMEYSEFVDLNQLGAVVTKGVAKIR